MSKQDENKEYVKLPFFGIPKLLPFMKPYRVKILTMMAMGVVTSGMDIVWPLFTQYAINHFIADTTLKGLPVFILLYVLCLGIQVLMSYISCSYAGQIEMYIGRDLKRESFNHLQNLSFSYFNQNSVGYILARVMSDTGRIGGMVSWDLMDSVWNLSYLIGVIISMLLLNWKLALIVLIIVPFTTVVSVYFQKHLVVLNRKIREINSQISGNFNEGITGAKTTKISTPHPKR